MHVCLFQQSSKAEDVKSGDAAKDNANHFWNPYINVSVSHFYAFLLQEVHMNLQAEPNYTLTLSSSVSLSVSALLLP